MKKKKKRIVVTPSLPTSATPSPALPNLMFKSGLFFCDNPDVEFRVSGFGSVAPFWSRTPDTPGNERWIRVTDPLPADLGRDRAEVFLFFFFLLFFLFSLFFSLLHSSHRPDKPNKEWRIVGSDPLPAHLGHPLFFFFSCFIFVYHKPVC